MNRIRGSGGGERPDLAISARRSARDQTADRQRSATISARSAISAVGRDGRARSYPRPDGSEESVQASAFCEAIRRATTARTTPLSDCHFQHQRRARFHWALTHRLPDVVLYRRLRQWSRAYAEVSPASQSLLSGSARQSAQASQEAAETPPTWEGRKEPCCP